MQLRLIVLQLVGGELMAACYVELVVSNNAEKYLMFYPVFSRKIRCTILSLLGRLVDCLLFE